MNKNKSYCTLPFNHVCVKNEGRYALCCEATSKYSFVGGDTTINQINFDEWFHSDYMNQIRNAMKQGRTLKECTKCYEEESIGRVSPRMNAIANQPADNNKPVIKTINLKFGNKCNLKCKMCFPGASSELMKEWQALGWDNPINDPLEGQPGWHGQRWNNEDYNWPTKTKNIDKLLAVAKYVEEVAITGGEPMISPQLIKFMQECVDRGYSKTIQLHITTNCTKIHPRFLKLAQQFARLEIRASIDGIGRTYEYVRYPAVWKQVDYNFNKICEWYEKGLIKTGVVSINFALSVFNLHQVPDFIEMFADRVYNICGRDLDHLNIAEVCEPQFMSWVIASTEQQRETQNKLIKLAYNYKGKPIGSVAEQTLRIFARYNPNLKKRSDNDKLRDFILSQDGLRKINIKDYIPGLTSLIT